MHTCIEYYSELEASHHEMFVTIFSILLECAWRPVAWSSHTGQCNYHCFRHQYIYQY